MSLCTCTRWVAAELCCRLWILLLFCEILQANENEWKWNQVPFPHWACGRNCFRYKKYMGLPCVWLVNWDFLLHVSRLLAHNTLNFNLNSNYNWDNIFKRTLCCRKKHCGQYFDEGLGAVSKWKWSKRGDSGVLIRCQKSLNFLK